MKFPFKILLLLLLLHPTPSQAKSLSGQIKLSGNATLLWKIADFNKSKHHITWCRDGEPNSKYPCKIDHQTWFGEDGTYTLPAMEIVYLTLKINKQMIRLKTTKMFNPVFSLHALDPMQFKLKKFSDHSILYAFFSDGAGTYTVYWKIEKGKSTRIKISKKDTDFQWQFE